MFPEMLDAVVAIRECSTSTLREASVAKLMRRYTKKFRKSSAFMRLKTIARQKLYLKPSCWYAFQVKKAMSNVCPGDYTYTQTLRCANRNAIADPTPCKRVGLPPNILAFCLRALLVWSMACSIHGLRRELQTTDWWTRTKDPRHNHHPCIRLLLYATNKWGINICWQLAHTRTRLISVIHSTTR